MKKKRDEQTEKLWPSIALFLISITLLFGYSAITGDLFASEESPCETAKRTIPITTNFHDVFRSHSGRYVALVTQRTGGVGRASGGIEAFSVYDMKENCLRHDVVSGSGIIPNRSIEWNEDETRLLVRSYRESGINCPCEHWVSYEANGSSMILNFD